jgi:biopolymer transport protein ExbB/TolQ
LSEKIFIKRIDEEKIKGIAVSVGMLLTFIGIFAGLYNFDTKNIEESIPLLLDGLKTAFITSIAGLIISVLATMKEKYSDSTEGKNSAENNQKEILEELKSLNKNISGGEEGSVNNLLKSIDKNIGGEGSYSLVGQVKELKDDNSEKLQSLKNSFEEFAKKMAENNMDALTEAIEKVMGEFNTTINEKLGETFDNFRKSVEELNI